MKGIVGYGYIKKKTSQNEKTNKQLLSYSSTLGVKIQALKIIGSRIKCKFIVFMLFDDIVIRFLKKFDAKNRL